MWELIAANRRKSILLALALALCLALVGAVAGASLNPQAPDAGAFTGVGLAFLIWTVMSGISWTSGDAILLSSSGAKLITPEIDPRLFNVVEEMKIAAGLPVMPKVYVIDSPEPNAFATGIRIQNASVAVTAGLLSRLSRDELQGVIAHEVSHILNRDVLFMTFAGVMLGAIDLTANLFLRNVRYASSKRFRSRNGGSGGAVVMVLGLVLMILGPVLARLFYFAISRKREYLADASGARLTRYPEGLASALEKIAAGSSFAYANRVTAPMYIAHPEGGSRGFFYGIGSTHPPIGRRISILRAMGRSAGFVAYEEAFRRLARGGSTLMPPSALENVEDVPVRAAAEDSSSLAPQAAARDSGDLMRVLNGYLFLPCACGLRIKIPQGQSDAMRECPRCGAPVDVPVARPLAAAVAGDSLPWIRRGKGWQSFACRCGKLVQLSPAFHAAHIDCAACGQRTNIQ